MTHRWWSRHLAVFVRAALRTSAHSVRSAVSATGLGGVVGNKGGLAISFPLGTTSRPQNPQSYVFQVDPL